VERLAGIVKVLGEKGVTKPQIDRFLALLEEYVTGNDSPKLFIDNFVSSLGVASNAQANLDKALANVEATLQRKNARERAALVALNDRALDLQAKILALEDKLNTELGDEMGRRRTQYALDNMRGLVVENAAETRTLDAKVARFKALYMRKEGIEALRVEVSVAREKTAANILPLIPSVLGVISDVQRRAFLQLRFVLLFPAVSTLCCNRMHCFKCHTVQHPPGVSCQEAAANLPTEIRQCPQCNMSITKGDGCSSVRCVCGHGFSWTEGKVVT